MPSLFWSSIATGSASETAEFLATHLKRVIGEVQREIGAIVAGVLTDNASNMSAAWRLLEEELPVFGGGCSAHVLNLLIQDMCKLDFFKTSQANALAITAFVRDHHAVLSQFQTMLKETCNDHHRALSVPVATRWYSLHACLSRVLENKGLLEKLFLEGGHTELIARSASTPTAVDKLEQVQANLKDGSFWRELRQVVAFLDPVIDGLRELEADNYPTSRVYSRYRELLNHHVYGTDGLRTDLQASLRDIVEYRWNFVHTDATGLAFYLDPHTDLDLFVSSDEDTIHQGYKFAERSGILRRLGITRAEFTREMYQFAGDKRRWSPDTKAKFEGAHPLNPIAAKNILGICMPDTP